MIASALIVERSGRAAEFGDDDDERFIEQRLPIHRAGHRREIAQQCSERRIEVGALRIERARRGLVVDVAVMIPTAERRLHESRSFA